jgi:hypothetical protein
MTKRAALLIFFVAAYLVVLGQDSGKIKKVSGKGEMEQLSNMTAEQAKAAALERAKIEALANEFGTYISKTEQTLIGEGTSTYNALAFMDVKGEITETTNEECEMFTKGEEIWWRCKFEGKARERKSSTIDLEYHVLGCLDKDCKKTDFNTGEDIFLYFQSPINGYVSAYLLDDANAYCLLPYEKMDGKGFEVKANESYFLFSKKYPYYLPSHQIDEYQVYTEKSSEANALVLIFSPSIYYAPRLKDGELAPETIRNYLGDNAELPRTLTIKEFENWLAENKSKSEDFIEIRQSIFIKK